MPSCALYMTSYPHFMTTALIIYDITCTLFMTSHALYMTCHLLCMISHSLYVWHHTLPVSQTSLLYMASHTVLWQHNHCVPSQPLCLTSHPLYLCHLIQCIYFIIPSVCMTSQPLCVWHHMHHMWHHIHSLRHCATLCMTWGPLYLTSLPQYLCHHTNPFDDITGTICMTSNPVYLWHHNHYFFAVLSTKYDITKLCADAVTFGICMTTFALQMTAHTLYHTKPQYLWCHFPFRQDKRAPVSDITPTFCVTSYELYITSQPILMSSHYCTCNITASIYETTSSMRETYTLNMWHHSHHLGHHTHCIGSITPSLFMTSHSPYVWHRLHYTRYCILTFWPENIFLSISHPLS